jgi:hypothetical protein
MTACPRCGTEPPEGAVFCPSCGARTSALPEVVAANPAWDVDRPAIPDDLFRPPAEIAPDTPDDHLFRGPTTSTDPEATVVRPVVPPPVPSPSWAYRPGTPEADLLPSERPYVGAPPTVTKPARGGFSGARGVILLLVLLVVAAIAGGVLWFTGGGSPTAVKSPSKSAAATTSASAAVAPSPPASAQGASVTPSTIPSDAFPPAGATLCPGSTSVAVNSTTSCGFAQNVAAAIPAGSTGSFTVTANSPATQKDYQMACLRGTYTVCTGGVNALVYVK